MNLVVLGGEPLDTLQEVRRPGAAASSLPPSLLALPVLWPVSQHQPNLHALSLPPPLSVHCRSGWPSCSARCPPGAARGRSTATRGRPLRAGDCTCCPRCGTSTASPRPSSCPACRRSTGEKQGGAAVCLLGCASFGQGRRSSPVHAPFVHARPSPPLTRISLAARRPRSTCHTWWATRAAARSSPPSSRAAGRASCRQA